MAERGWLEAPQGQTGNRPDLTDPLGAPKYVTGPEVLDALSHVGWNINDPYGLSKSLDIAKQGTSLLEQVYNQRMAVDKQTADLGEINARARLYDTQSAYNDASLQSRIAKDEADAKVAKANADNIGKVLANQNAEADNRIASGKNLLEQQRMQLENEKQLHQQNQDALGRVDGALAEMPSPYLIPGDSTSGIDPQFETKRDAWRLKYNELMQNPLTKDRIMGAYSAADDIYQKSSQARYNVAQLEEGRKLQAAGYIGEDVDLNALQRNGTLGPDALIPGRIKAAMHDSDLLASQLPAGDARREVLLGMQRDAAKLLGSDTGIQDVQKGRSQWFNNNGNLTGSAQAALAQAQAELTAAAEQAKAEAATKTQVTIGIGQPDKAGNYPQHITGTADVVDKWLQSHNMALPVRPEQRTQRLEQILKLPGGLATPEGQMLEQTPEGKTYLQNRLGQFPAGRDLLNRVQRKQITFDQFLEELNNLDWTQAPSGATAAPVRGTTLVPNFQQGGTVPAMPVASILPAAKAVQEWWNRPTDQVNPYTGKETLAVAPSTAASNIAGYEAGAVSEWMQNLYNAIHFAGMPTYPKVSDDPGTVDAIRNMAVSIGFRPQTLDKIDLTDPAWQKDTIDTYYQMMRTARPQLSTPQIPASK